MPPSRRVFAWGHGSTPSGGRAYGLEVHGLPSSYPRSRLTFDESPLRESCTVGSVGEVPGNWHLYPTI